MFNLQGLGVFIDERNWTSEQWGEQITRQNRVYFLGAWNHAKNMDTLLEYKQDIIRLFRPHPRYRDRVELLFSRLKTGYDVVVGIHIRKGDYKGFLNGIYYFENSVYQAYMQQIADMHAGRKVCFYIASNEAINTDDFPGLSVSFLENANMMEDLYALSQCDLLLGPPSTYSMWASWTGRAPLRIIKDAGETLDREQFSPVLYQDVFENGQVFTHKENPAAS